LQFTISDAPGTTPAIAKAIAGTDFVASDVSECNGGTNYPNGHIKLKNITPAAGYYYRWFVGADTSGTRIVNASNIASQKSISQSGYNTSVTGASTDSIYGLDPGQYTVVAIDSASGCVSALTAVRHPRPAAELVASARGAKEAPSR
jgi:hypothetical protein